MTGLCLAAYMAVATPEHIVRLQRYSALTLASQCPRWASNVLLLDGCPGKNEVRASGDIRALMDERAVEAEI